MGRLNDVSREVRQLAVMVSYHILDHWIRLVCIQEKYVQEFTRLLRILVKEEDKSVREVAEGNFINPSFINYWKIIYYSFGDTGVLKAIEEQEFLKCGNDLPRLHLND